MAKVNFDKWFISKQDAWKNLVAQSELEKIAIYTQEAKNNPIMKDFNKNRSLLAYRRAEKNAWIYITLSEKKKLSLFKECKRLVLVGCGMYPYSMFDIHKKYKNIQQVGIEIDKNRAMISKKLVEHSPAKDHISIVHMDGKDYDFNELEEQDLIFISCDVDNKQIINSIIEKSKAHFFVCAPYNKTWFKNTMKYIQITCDEHGNIVRNRTT